jgi:hypothetical protein
MKSKILFCILFFVSAAIAQDDYLELKSGRKVISKFLITEPSFWGENNYVFQLSESLKYTQDSVRAYQKDGGYFKWYGEDRVYLKRTEEGKVDFYSRIKGGYSAGFSYGAASPGGMHMASMPGTYNAVRYDYYCKNKGPVKEVSYDNVLEDFSDNPASKKYLDDYGSANVVKYCLGVAGAGLIIAGIADKSGSKPNMSTLTAGAVVVNLAWIPFIIQNSCVKKAAKVYNKN